MLQLEHIFFVFAWCLITIVTSVNTTLEWSSFWQFSEWSDIEQVQNSINFMFDESNQTWLINAHNNYKISSLYPVESVFFESNATTSHLQLRNDYLQSWNDTKTKIIDPLLTNGVLFGVFMGDELTWNGLPYDQLVTAISTVRNDYNLRNSFTIYYNEAYPVFTKDVNIFGDTIGYSKVPIQLDWISMDYYPDEGTFDQVISIYDDNIFPIMQNNQSSLYVPPSYGTVNETDSNRYCGESNCTAAMIQWANDAYNWAIKEDRIIGLNPWHWRCYPASEVTGFSQGADCMPGVKNKWIQIGQSIVNVNVLNSNGFNQ